MTPRPWSVDPWKPLIDLPAADYAAMVAHHEAGHAVVAILTGLPVRWIEIAENPRAPGSEVMIGPFQITACEWVSTLWAGHRAQTRWLEENGLATAATRSAVYACCELDIRRISEFGPHAFGWSAAADRHLDGHWPAVQALAARLVPGKRVEGLEVRHLLGGLGCWPPRSGRLLRGGVR